MTDSPAPSRSGEATTLTDDLRRLLKAVAGGDNFLWVSNDDQRSPRAEAKRLLAALSAPPAPTALEVPDDERCSDCMEAKATVCYESGDDRCEACAKILDARMEERERITEWAASKCETLLTGFKSDLHEAYDNGVRDCAKIIRDPHNPKWTAGR